jgi:hypothetical protein
MGRRLIAQSLRFPPAADRYGMGQIAGGKPVPERPFRQGLLHVLQVFAAMLAATADDAFGDF